jgi:type II secretory pathway pseudopilin PulG
MVSLINEVSAAKARCAGFTYIALLLAFAAAGIFMLAVSEVWQTALKREKEDELLYAGDQIRQALTRYAMSAPGGERYPRRLEDLLRDPRYPLPRRYLRQVYRDPMTPSGEWALVRTGEFITGVHSQSEEQPLKTAAFRFADRAFEGKEKYSEWIFLLVEPARVTRARTATTPAAAKTTATPTTTTPKPATPPTRAPVRPAAPPTRR